MVGCAGVSVEPVVKYTEDSAVIRPSVMLIYDFAVDPKDVTVDTAGLDLGGDKGTSAERLKAGRAVAQLLSEELVTELAERGVTAKRAVASTNIPMHAVVVKGQFMLIDEGDQMKRTVIGFGAGSDELRVRVQVYQMTKGGLQRISEAKAEAHGRKTPGVAGPGAVAAGAGVVTGLVVSGAMNIKSEVKGSMATNVKNLAEEFADRVEKFYKRRGWL